MVGDDHAFITRVAPSTSGPCSIERRPAPAQTEGILMIDIRPLADSDSIPELTSLLHRAYAELARMGLNYTAVDQTPETTAKRIRGGTCFVAHDAAELIGTVLVHPTYTTNHCEYFTRPGVACAHQFAVDPGRRSQGIGRLLLHRAEQWAAERGFSELAMDTAEPATHLVALYNRLGYHHVGQVQWPGKVYRSVVLSKRLAGEAAAHDRA